jgi:hypothetical protein
MNQPGGCVSKPTSCYLLKQTHKNLTSLTMTSLKMDPLAGRIADLAKHAVVALQPALAELERLRDDAGRQLDPTLAAAVMVVRERVVTALEAGVEEGRWVRVREAAEITRRAEGTVRYWCRRRLVTARMVGGEYEIDRGSLIRRAAA